MINLPDKFMKTIHVVLAHAEGPDFSLLDRKVFNVLYANAYRKMRANPHERLRHRIKMTDLAAAVQQPTNDLRVLQMSLERLWSVKVKIEYTTQDKENRVLHCHYLSYNMSKMEGGDLEYAFDELLMQFIANQKVYALIELNVSSSMTSLYGSRLYEAMSMIQRMWKPYWDPSMEEFRDYFELGDKYERFDHLKVKVIDRAVEDVNRHAPFNVEVDYIRSGRGGRVEGMHFRTVPKLTEEFQLEGRPGKVRADLYTIDMFDGVPEADKLVPPELRTDTVAEAERLLGADVDVLQLRDQWFNSYGTRAHTSPDEMFLAWIKVQKGKQENEVLKNVDLDLFLDGLVSEK